MVRYADPRIANEPPIVIMRELTAEQYFSLSESSQPQNLVNGLLYASPHPTEHHEDVVLAIAEALDRCARTANGKVFVGRDCWLGDTTVVQPDVAYLGAERMHLAGRFLRGAPDIVVEVVSANTMQFDREVKFAAYGVSPAREAWFVDLEQEQVSVFVAGNGSWQSLAPVAFGEPIPSQVVPNVGAAGLAIDAN